MRVETFYLLTNLTQAIRNTYQNKKNPQGFMNLEDCTRFFILTTSPAHEGLLVLEQTRYSGFWGSATLELTYYPRLPISFQRKRNSGIAGLVPSYSGGTTRDFHPLPCIRSVNMLEVTIERTAQHCQAKTQGILIPFLPIHRIMRLIKILTNAPYPEESLTAYNKEVMTISFSVHC